VAGGGGAGDGSLPPQPLRRMMLSTSRRKGCEMVTFIRWLFGESSWPIAKWWLS